MKATFLLLAIFGLSYSPEEKTAIVETREGIDIYAFSRPSKEFEIVKSSTVTFAFNGCKDWIPFAIKKAKSESADAVIIYFDSKGKFDIIKYK